MNLEAIHFAPSADKSELAPFKFAWRKSLTAPQDDMWEAFTELASHWEVKNHDEIIGYACVNDDNQLLQFFLSPIWLHRGAFILQNFIHQQEIKKAIIGTNNPIALSLAMHLQQSVEIDTYLFSDFVEAISTKKEGNLRLAAAKDLEILIEFCHKSMGGAKDWLRGYLSNLISKNELFIFILKGEILGTCEVRQSQSEPQIAAVGMIVSPSNRRQGIGTFLLGQAKDIALQRGKHPICSCEKSNTGSFKSIIKNGFRSIHQMLLISFE